MRNITIYEIVDWIVKHKEGTNAFKDYPINKIASEIIQSVRHGVFRIETNSKEEIIGVICGEKFEKARCILIHDVLTITPEALKLLWSRYLITFPDWTLVGGHKGKMKTFYKAKQKV
jgi:hypothetical protein